MIRNRLLGSIRLPGMIQVLYAPDEAGAGGGTSGGGSTPSTPATPSPSSSSPSGATPATPSESSGGGASPQVDTSPQPLPEDAFSGFGATDDEEGDDASTTSAPQETPAAPAAPTPPAQAQTPPAPPAAAVATPPAQTPTEQPAQPGQEGVQPRLPTPAEPAAMGASILQNFDAMADHLATQPEFQLSEADIEAINTDLVGAIPKLGARIFLRAQASALSQMERVIPAMVQKYMKATEAQTKSKGAFYVRWPQIKEAEHGAVVDRIAATYRRENPNATRDEMIEAIGPYVMMAAKIAPSAAQQSSGSNGQHPAARRGPPSPPFTPAVGGPASIPEPTAEDPWTGYGAQTDE